jgi:general secretion pathway protein D
MKTRSIPFQKNRSAKVLSYAGIFMFAGFLPGCEYLGQFSKPQKVPEMLHVQPVKPLPEPVEEVVIEPRGVTENEYYPATEPVYASGSDKQKPDRKGRLKDSVTAPASSRHEGKYTLNFDDAEISEVAKVILGDTLKLNYVINPKVVGKISLQTTSPLADDEMIPALETLLRMNGAALIKSDAIYRIEPEAAAIINAPNGGSGLVGKIQPGFQVRVVPLHYVGAREMQKVLEPLLPPKSVVYADTLRNLLVVAANADDLANIKDTLSIFDVDFMRGMSVAIFPLKNVDPIALASELDALMMTGEKGAMAGLVRIMPVERLNSIMAISAQRAYLRDVETWIERLDRFNSQKSGNMHVYKVQNVDAVMLAQTLAQVFGTATTGGNAHAGPNASVAPGMSGTTIGGAGGAGGGAFGSSMQGGSGNTQGGSSGVSFGLSDNAQSGQGAAGSTPSTGSSSGGLGGIGSNTGGSSSSSAFGAAPGGTGSSGMGAPSTAGSGSSGMGGNNNRQSVVAELSNNARVIADPTNNALVIFAKPPEYHDIETVLKELDVLPKQVIVDAMIAEVTLTGALQYGLQWFLNQGQNTEANGGTGTTFMNGSAAAVAAGTATAASALTAVATGTGGFSYVLQASRVALQIMLLAQDGKARILSTPSLMVLNNQEAQINVGNKIPIQTGSLTTQTGGVPSTANSNTYTDTGVTLKIKPHVNDGGLVTMTVQQEISQANYTIPGATTLTPAIQQRKILTSIAVHNGDTLALGGLIQETDSDNLQGIPVLSELPYVGWLFGTTTKSINRTEMVMLLSPRTVETRPDATRVTNEFRKRLTVWGDQKGAAMPNAYSGE